MDDVEGTHLPSIVKSAAPPRNRRRLCLGTSGNAQANLYNPVTFQLEVPHARSDS